MTGTSSGTPSTRMNAHSPGSFVANSSESASAENPPSLAVGRGLASGDIVRLAVLL
ncbi:hypothetical protein [Halorientalis persicus]|uniref:hypothetical protein n=1 Tax=Halorientalis persicus TaxID=1367881 RepID=UPI00147F0B3E|nr:hypothetical protein [Halorientalis persicus]